MDFGVIVTCQDFGENLYQKSWNIRHTIGHKYKRANQNTQLSGLKWLDFNESLDDYRWIGEFGVIFVKVL